jgi:hypothetical protein
MKTYLIAYRKNYEMRQLDVAFTVMVHDELVTVTALKMLRNGSPLLWAQRKSGFIRAKLIAPQPPFHFLPSAVLHV